MKEAHPVEYQSQRYPNSYLYGTNSMRQTADSLKASHWFRDAFYVKEDDLDVTVRWCVLLHLCIYDSQADVSE